MNNETMNVETMNVEIMYSHFDKLSLTNDTIKDNSMGVVDTMNSLSLDNQIQNINDKLYGLIKSTHLLYDNHFTLLTSLF